MDLARVLKTQIARLELLGSTEQTAGTLYHHGNREGEKNLFFSKTAGGEKMVKISCNESKETQGELPLHIAYLSRSVREMLGWVTLPGESTQGEPRSLCTIQTLNDRSVHYSKVKVQDVTRT